MNERIRDLLPNPFAVDYQVEDGPLDLYTEKEMLRFAKLIVRECANWMEDEQNDAGDRIGDSFYWSDRLKQHFGVEV